MSNEHFSVWQFFIGGEYIRVAEGVSAGAAIKAASHCANSVGAEVGLIERIVITDSGDATVFEWKHGEGITWPPRKDSAVVEKTD